MTRTGVSGPAIGAEAPRTRHGAIAGKAARKRSKGRGSARHLRRGSSTGTPTVIENVSLSPGKIAIFTQPKSPATSPVVPRGARARRRR